MMNWMGYAHSRPVFLFKARYESILAEKVTEDDEFFPNPGSFDSSRRRYYDYIERQLAEVNAHLEVLRETLKRTYGPVYRGAVPKAVPSGADL